MHYQDPPPKNKRNRNQLVAFDVLQPTKILGVGWVDGQNLKLRYIKEKIPQFSKLSSVSRMERDQPGRRFQVQILFMVVGGANLID
jgi:hypothetical protein